MAGYVFNRGATGLLDGTITFSSATIKARLSLTSETPSKDATSMTGIGLSATDVTLANKTGPTEDLGNDRVLYDNTADLTFAAVAAGAEVNKIVVFKFSVNDAGSTPIAVVEFSPAITPNGGDIVFTPSSSPSALFYTQE